MTVPLTSAVVALAGSDLPPNRQHTAAGMQQAITAAASALGLSTNELRSQLSGGASLTQVAIDRGVPLNFLTASVTQALVNADPPVAPDRAAALAARLVQPRPAPAPLVTSSVDVRL